MSSESVTAPTVRALSAVPGVVTVNGVPQLPSLPAAMVTRVS